MPSDGQAREGGKKGEPNHIVPFKAAKWKKKKKPSAEKKKASGTYRLRKGRPLQREDWARERDRLPAGGKKGEDHRG